ncbi:hypothetical protein Tco_0416089, partial [Tanacetum coccineum]
VGSVEGSDDSEGDDVIFDGEDEGVGEDSGVGEVRIVGVESKIWTQLG